MAGELYDLDALRRGRETILANIKAFEDALELERKKLAEYDRHIIAAEVILNMHGYKE